MIENYNIRIFKQKKNDVLLKHRLGVNLYDIYLDYLLYICSCFLINAVFVLKIVKNKKIIFNYFSLVLCC